MQTEVDWTPEQKRELGKVYFFNSVGDEEKKKQGLNLILEAYAQKDPEATYIVAKMILDGILHVKKEDQAEYALMLMYSSARKGYLQARVYLNEFCKERYETKHGKRLTERKNGALVDFNGKPIKINRKGFFTPVDAVLEYKDGKNILTLSTQISFINELEIENFTKFNDAVCKGLLSWQGEYEVFGGQKLTVRVCLTDNNIFDSIIVIPMTEDFSSNVKRVSDLINRKKDGNTSDFIAQKRSFATFGRKWSVKSRKIIGIFSKNGCFDDYEEITNIAKHEFGHILGLGDLYESKSDSLPGVKKGTYSELDSYVITDKFYNLVMCEHNGPISNNDIEMIVLAFRENKAQLYQPSKFKGKISAALGRGN